MLKSNVTFSKQDGREAPTPVQFDLPITDKYIMASLNDITSAVTVVISSTLKGSV